MSRRFLQKVAQRLNRGVPDGLVSPRYLLLYQTEYVRIHRQIWWASKHPKIPRPVWLVLQLIFWLRWVLFEGWIHTFKVVKSRHAAVTKIHTIPYRTQLRRCLCGAFGWSILANDLYDNNIIQTHAPLLGFVYSNEMAGWHALQNQAHPKAQEAQKLLSNKRVFADVMHAKGFPVVQDFPSPNADNARPFAEQFQSDQTAVFCKLNRGNQALHAFAAYWDKGQLRGHFQTGQALEDADDVNAAWDRLIAHGAPIVQPCLHNHPEIAAISRSDRIANLRVITRGNRIGAANIALFASDDVGDTFWMDIDPETGRPFLPSSMYPVHHPKRQQYQTIVEDAPPNIPFWNQIREHSLRAHTGHFDLWAIAWDWAVTPDGPILLEGNSGWGLQDWQLQNGSLLLPFDSEAH